MRLAFWILIAAGWCFGQEFEVVSIKPNNSMSGSSRSSSNQGVFRATNLSLRRLVLMAYGLNDYQVEGPDWLGSDHYDISAKFPEKLPSGPEHREEYAAAFRAMLQKMLADRFNVAAHREKKSLPVYGLLVGKNGIRFKEVPLGNSSSNTNNTHFVGTSVSMTQFASFLSDQLDRPVVDATALKGYYDLKLDWVVDARKQDTTEAAAGLTIFDALDEQLGLKLDRRKAPIEMLVVDRAERVASEN